MWVRRVGVGLGPRRWPPLGHRRHAACARKLRSCVWAGCSPRAWGRARGYIAGEGTGDGGESGPTHGTKLNYMFIRSIVNGPVTCKLKGRRGGRMVAEFWQRYNEDKGALIKVRVPGYHTPRARHLARPPRARRARAAIPPSHSAATPPSPRPRTGSGDRRLGVACRRLNRARRPRSTRAFEDAPRPP